MLDQIANALSPMLEDSSTDEDDVYSAAPRAREKAEAECDSSGLELDDSFELFEVKFDALPLALVFQIVTPVNVELVELLELVLVELTLVFVDEDVGVVVVVVTVVFEDDELLLVDVVDEFDELELLLELVVPLKLLLVEFVVDVLLLVLLMLPKPPKVDIVLLLVLLEVLELVILEFVEFVEDDVLLVLL